MGSVVRLVPILLLACLAAPAAPCINDSDSRGQEEQFRSQYAGQPARPSQRAWNALGIGITAVSAGLIAASAWLAFSSTPRRR